MAIQFPVLKGRAPDRRFDSLADAILQMKDRRRQEQALMAENLRFGEAKKRQDQQDFQATYLKASQLAAAGDLEGAQALMAPYGGQRQTQEVTIPGAPPAPRPQPNAMGALADDASPDEISQATEADDATKPTGFQALRDAEAAQRKKMLHTLRGQWGQNQWTIDPEASRQQRGQRYDEAFGESQDPITKELYPQMRGALMASDQPADTTDVFKFIQGEKNNRRQETAADERERRRLEAEARRNAEFDRRFPMQEAGRDRRASLAAGLRGATVAQGAQRIELSTEAAAREATNKVFQNMGFKDIQVGNRKFNDMASNLSATPNAALDAVTAGTFVKMAQGGTGVISDSDMRVFWERIGGLGMKVESAIQGLVDGTLPPDKRAAVLGAVKELAGTARRNLSQVQQALEYQFDTSPNLSPYKDQMVGTYFPGPRARSQNKAAAGKGGKVDMSVYDFDVKGGER